MQKIFGFLRKYGFLIVLLLIILFLLFGPKTSNLTEKPTTNNNNESSNNIPTSTPTKYITPTINPYIQDSINYANSGQSEPADLTDADPSYPLAALLPYRGNGFTVEEYIAPLVLRVKIKDKAAITRTEGELRRWLDQYELIPGSNKITWSIGE
jgi:hypothetical protein